MSWAFWLEGVCIPIISTFGLLGKSATFLFLQVAFQLAGNICSIWVLSSRRAHLDLSPTFTSLLICLVSRPAGESSSKVAQKSPKGTKMADLSVFDHLGPLLGPSGPFWTISDKNDFFAPNGQNRVLQRCFGAKYQFLFEMVQKGPDGPKRVPNVQKDLG